MTRPNCLHAGTLLKGRPVKIYWGFVNGARRYVLERRVYWEPDGLPGVFETASDNSYVTADLAHKGPRWSEVRAGAKTSARIRADVLTWRGIASLGIGDPEPHACFTDAIPREASHVEYRIRAIGESGESGYRYTAKIKALSHAPCDDDLTLEATVGEIMPVPVVSSAVTYFPPSMTVDYRPEELALHDIRGDRAEVIRRSDRSVEFKLAGTVDEATARSGLVAVLLFKPLRTGTTRIQMY